MGKPGFLGLKNLNFWFFFTNSARNTYYGKTNCSFSITFDKQLKELLKKEDREAPEKPGEKNVF